MLALSKMLPIETEPIVAFEKIYVDKWNGDSDFIFLAKSPLYVAPHADKLIKVIGQYINEDYFK